MWSYFVLPKNPGGESRDGEGGGYLTRRLSCLLKIKCKTLSLNCCVPFCCVLFQFLFNPIRKQVSLWESVVSLASHSAVNGRFWFSWMLSFVWLSYQHIKWQHHNHNACGNWNTVYKTRDKYGAFLEQAETFSSGFFVKHYHLWNCVW